MGKKYDDVDPAIKKGWENMFNEALKMGNHYLKKCFNKHPVGTSIVIGTALIAAYGLTQSQGKPKLTT